MIVPKSKVPDVLSYSYNTGFSGGHLGVKRTLLKLRERFTESIAEMMLRTGVVNVPVVLQLKVHT